MTNLKHLVKYLGATLTNQNCMHEAIKSRIKMGNACYHLAQNPWSSCSVSHNIQIKIYWTIILPVALHGCEICSLTLKDEHRLRVLENRVQGLEGRKQQETGANYIMSTCMICNPHQMEKTLVYMRVKRNTYRVLVRRHKGKSHLKDVHVGGRIIVRCILQK